MTRLDKALADRNGTDAVAERFIDRDIREAVEGGMGADEMRDADAEMLADVRDMRQMLDRIERRLTTPSDVCRE